MKKRIMALLLVLSMLLTLLPAIGEEAPAQEPAPKTEAAAEEKAPAEKTEEAPEEKAPAPKTEEAPEEKAPVADAEAAIEGNEPDTEPAREAEAPEESGTEAPAEAATETTDVPETVPTEEGEASTEETVEPTDEETLPADEEIADGEIPAEAEAEEDPVGGSVTVAAGTVLYRDAQLTVKKGTFDAKAALYIVSCTENALKVAFEFGGKTLSGYVRRQEAEVISAEGKVGEVAAYTAEDAAPTVDPEERMEEQIYDILPVEITDDTPAGIFDTGSMSDLIDPEYYDNGVNATYAYLTCDTPVLKMNAAAGFNVEVGGFKPTKFVVNALFQKANNLVSKGDSYTYYYVKNFTVTSPRFTYTPREAGKYRFIVTVYNKSGKYIRFLSTTWSTASSDPAKDYISPAYNKVKTVLNEIIKPGMSDIEKARAVHDWIILNCEYDYDAVGNPSNGDPAQHAYGVLVNGMAVCEGYAEAYMMMMRELGFECTVVESEYDNHAWNLIRIGGNWYHVDCTWDDEGGSNVGDFYFMFDDYSPKSHLWNINEKGNDNAFVPQAMSLSAEDLTLNAATREYKKIRYKCDYYVFEMLFTSSDESVATVDREGYVTAKSAGTATITLQPKGQPTYATCTVTVYDQPVVASCGSNTEITISGGVATINGSGAVTGNLNGLNVYSVEKIVIGEGVTSVNNILAGAGNATTVVIPASVERIDENAFKYCDLLYVEAEPGTFGEQWAKDNGCLMTEAELSVTKSQTVTLNRGVTYTLNTGDKEIKSVKSSKSSVATVTFNDGIAVIRANGVGTAKVTVTLANNKVITLTVKVVNPRTPTKISLVGGTSYLMTWDDRLQLEATLSPVTARSGIKWKVSNTALASVSNGEIRPKGKAGTVTVTVSTENGKKVTAKVKIVDPYKPEKLVLETKATQTIYFYDEVHVGCSVWPESADPMTDITWKSSDTRIATVDPYEGIVTAKGKAGTVTITATGTCGKVKKTASYKVKVLDPTKATSVSLNYSGTVTVNRYDVLRLTATMLPVTATSKITYTSSNTSVAKVSAAGIVSAIGAGTATITAKTSTGKTASFKVKVSGTAAAAGDLSDYVGAEPATIIGALRMVKEPGTDFVKMYVTADGAVFVGGDKGIDHVQTYAAGYPIHGVEVGMTVSQARAVADAKGWSFLGYECGSYDYDTGSGYFFFEVSGGRVSSVGFGRYR